MAKAPITPDDVGAAKINQLPDFVIDAFNTLIAKHWDGKLSTFTQQEAVSLIIERGCTSRTEIYDKRWLDVEPAYEAVGWKVTYDKPGYNESYPATFTFGRSPT